MRRKLEIPKETRETIRKKAEGAVETTKGKAIKRGEELIEKVKTSKLTGRSHRSC